MLMGDEYGHTRYGNNNSYGHDTAINNFQWQQVKIYQFSDDFNPDSTLLMIFFYVKTVRCKEE